MSSPIELLNSKIEGVEINAENIIKVLRFAMEVVEATETKGEEQKDIVIDLLKQVITAAPIADEKEKLLLDMIDEGILGSTIDFVISASKGELDINAAVEVAQNCSTTCFGGAMKKYLK